jgi:hypothetical protein
MRRRRSRLAFIGVLALAVSVVAGLASGSVAEAKKKGKGKAVVSKTVNAAVPDKAPGASGVFGQLDVPLKVGKKFKGKVVAPDGPSVTFQTTGDSANAANDLSIWLIAPNGRMSQLGSDTGGLGGQSIGPLTLTSDSARGVCNSATPPCTNPLATLNRPFAGTALDSYLVIYNGAPVTGTWHLIFQDTTNTKTSIVNLAKLSIPTA